MPSGMPGTQNDGLPQQPITRIEFLNAVFEKTKPSPLVARVLTSKPGTYPKDSLLASLVWAEETENAPLIALLNADLFESKMSDAPQEEIARNLIFAGAGAMETPIQSAYLFQLGKNYIDKGLAANPNNVPPQKKLNK